MDAQTDKRAWVATAMTALTHPRRVAILDTLLTAPDGLIFEDLMERTGLSTSTLTHHLRTMKSAKLVVTKRQAQRVAHFVDGGAVVKTLASLQTRIEKGRSPKRPALKSV